MFFVFFLNFRECRGITNNEKNNLLKYLFNKIENLTTFGISRCTGIKNLIHFQYEICCHGFFLIFYFFCF